MIGGLLSLGIPEFKLEKWVVQEELISLKKKDKFYNKYQCWN